MALCQTAPLPGGLSEKSSVAEIVDWLGKSTLTNARIGLTNEVNEPDPAYQTDIDPRSEWATFSQGFKVSKMDGCKLVLRNEDPKLLEFATKYPDPKKGSLSNYRKTPTSQTKFPAELYLPLDGLEPNKRKAPYQITKDPKKAAELGTWQTKFNYRPAGSLSLSSAIKIIRKPKGPFPPNEFRLEIIGSGVNQQNEKFNASQITFTFDDNQTATDFYAAFRRAVELCSVK